VSSPTLIPSPGVSAARRRSIIGSCLAYAAEIPTSRLAFCTLPAYQLTSDGIDTFREKLRHFVGNAMIAFPDGHGDSARLTLPLQISFRGGHDDRRIYTPPFAHRRVLNDSLEFGSRTHFSHSWASLGKHSLSTFSLNFRARFSNPLEGAWIGVGLRSQHFFANFAHLLYLRGDGAVVLTQPNEEPPDFYTDVVLRAPSPVDVTADHSFGAMLDEKALTVEVDEFKKSIELATMPKVFGPGLIRLQSWNSWMALSELRVLAVDPAANECIRQYKMH
jgi:hypothetical protein